MNAKGRSIEQTLELDLTLDSNHTMRDDEVREALHLMLISRAFDDYCIKLQRLNRVGVYGPAMGQEAAIIGSAMALDPELDWMVPASREQAAWLRQGLPLTGLFAIYMGRLDNAAVPPGVKLMPRQQAIGAQIPQAAGLAWAQKIRGTGAAVMVYLGEGAASEGDFHEGANLAGVMGAPLVLVIINNQYAISTPARKQSAAEALSLRAAGYGYPGVTVDGNDLFAVHAAASAAVKRARAGNGPTLIECLTYRLSFHNTSDNPNVYRDPDEVTAAAQHDPIARLKRWVVSNGLLTEMELTALDGRVKCEIEGAYEMAASFPRPGPEALFDHAYAELPPRLEDQRRQTVDS